MYKTIKTAALIILIALSAHAKERHSHRDNSGSGLSRTGAVTNTGDISRLSPAEIEACFRPFFEGRAENRRAWGKRGTDGWQRSDKRQSAGNTTRPSPKDLLVMMSKWNDLTPEFKALYKQATAIPSGLDSYVSPSGNFKIFYTTSGTDSVDVTDTIGYGSGVPSSWRDRQSSPNGIPDYIDVAAFGLDSAWAMIIDRFGFPAPLITPGPNGETDTYNVLIANLNAEDLYGVTYPQENYRGQIGFPSHIEINSSWPSNVWGDLGYDRRPYDAVLVTAAHEFFHAPQYSMVRTVYLDDLPYGWLEGSAVLMEEIAFPEINDYLQYIGGYFRNPRVSLLGNSDVYLNGIVLKYIYEKADTQDSIGLVKAVHVYNRDNNRPPFHRNIELAAQEHAKKSWAELLNAFHTESYFTGTRAQRPNAFISDAELMNAWNPPATATATVTGTVRPHSMEMFRYTPYPSHTDTLVLSIKGQRDASINGKTWAASALITDSAGISTVPIPIDLNGSGYLTLTNWKSKRGCLLIVTNGSGNSGRSVTVSIAPSDTSLSIRRNIVRISQQPDSALLVTGGNVSEITIVSQEGKLLARWHHGQTSPGFNTRNDGTVEWSPHRRLLPGTYFISAKSSKNEAVKRKIMLLP